MLATNTGHTCNFKFCNNIKNSKSKQLKIIFIYISFTIYVQNIFISTYNHHKNINNIFYFFFVIILWTLVCVYTNSTSQFELAIFQELNTY